MKSSLGSHEPLTQFRKVKQASARSFGLLFVLAFLLVGLGPLYRQHPVRIWAVTLSLAFLLASLLCPAWLEPLKRAWLKVGSVLQSIMIPLIMGILFFGLVTPIGFLMRLMGKDPLRLKWGGNRASHWQRREKAPWSRDMKPQF